VPAAAFLHFISSVIRRRGLSVVFLALDVIIYCDSFSFILWWIYHHIAILQRKAFSQ